jgi:prevent-host-death family protein
MPALEFDSETHRGYSSYMRSHAAVRVGIRELKNRLTTYLKLAKSDCDVIVTERGTPIAVIQPIGRRSASRSLESRIAALAAKGEVSAPERRLVARLPRVKIAGRPLSEQIVADRR